MKNTSGKPITHVAVSVHFPRPENHTASQGNPYGETLRYGINPFSPQDSVETGQGQAILPGNSIELVMSDESYNDTKTLLKELQFPDSIKRIEIFVETVGFEDGTAWNGGRFWRRDLKAPRGWSQIEQPQGSAAKRTAKFLA